MSNMPSVNAPRNIGQATDTQVTNPITTIHVRTDRTNQIEKREMAGRVDEQCQKLEASMQTKFGNLNSKLDILDTKFDLFKNTCDKSLEICKQNEHEIQALQVKIEEKDQRIASLEEQVKDMDDRLTNAEERFGDVHKQLLLQSEMLIQQNQKFDEIDNQSKTHALIVKNVPETQNTPRQDIDMLFGLLQVNLSCDRSCDKVYRIGRPKRNQTNSQPRPIYVELVKESQKGMIFLAMPNLKTTVLAKV